MADSSPSRDGSNLRLNQRRAVILRWWLLAAVAVAVSSAPTFLDIGLPRLPMFAVVGLMAGFNAYIQWSTRANVETGAAELFGQLCVDLVALGILLYLSGGAANPLISFLLVPVAVAALSLPGRHTAAVAVLAIAIYSLLMWRFLPLPVADAERGARLHLGGMWLTFVVSATMIAWFVARMTASIRERDNRLAAAREQALRDERVVALGAMAAGAAHELGTPLATMAVVVGELEQEPSLDADARADLALVREQIALCKGIISNMAARTGATRPEQLEAQDCAEWVRGVCARWQAMRPRAGSRVIVEGDGAPWIPIDAALEQGLTSLLNNAADASDCEIEVRLAWNEAALTIVIEDRGPGFPAEVLRDAGRAPLSAREGGAGIGLLLAFSAVERLGGRIALANRPGGGACVSIELPVARNTGS
jgi:two-component system sensor histidine kinase RegB